MSAPRPLIDLAGHRSPPTAALGVGGGIEVAHGQGKVARILGTDEDSAQTYDLRLPSEAPIRGQVLVAYGDKFVWDWPEDDMSHNLVTRLDYEQPDVGQEVTVALLSARTLQVNETLFIEGAGYYKVISIGSPSTATLELIESFLEPTGPQTVTAPRGVSVVGPQGFRGETGPQPDLSDNDPLDVGEESDPGDGETASRWNHVHAHGELSGGTHHAVVTDEAAGFMSPDLRAALLAAVATVAEHTDHLTIIDEILDGATPNATPGTLVERNGSGWIALGAGEAAPATALDVYGDATHRGHVFVKEYDSGGGAMATGDLRFYELSANGAHYLGFQAPDTLAGSVTWTLPNADAPADNYLLKSNGSAALGWLEATATATNETIAYRNALGHTEFVAVFGPNNDSLKFGTRSGGEGAYRMWLTTDGYLGIGVETPSQMLDVGGNARVRGLTIAGPVTTSSSGLLTSTAQLAPTYGGTGLTNVAQGDLLYGSATDTWARLAKGTTGYVLQAGASTPTWVSVASLGSVGLAVDSAGTDVGVSGSPASLGSTITLSIPSASAANRGLVTVAAQTLAGTKTFTGGIVSQAQAGAVLEPYGAGAGNTGELRFLELAANGTNYVGLKAPDILGGNVIWKLPSADATTSGQFLSSDAAGALSWVTAARSVVNDTNVTGSLAAGGALTLGWTGQLAATRGGTGQSGVATGDLLYGSATDTWSRLAAGTQHKVLAMGASTPAWSSLAVDSSGTDVAWTGLTLSIPSASASNRGVVTTSSQTFAGAKTFTAAVTVTNAQIVMSAAYPIAWGAAQTALIYGDSGSSYVRVQVGGADRLSVTTTGAQLAENGLLCFGGTNNGIYGNEASDYVRIKTNGADRLSINSSGLVGIGASNTAPRYVLDAADGGSLVSQIRFGPGTSDDGGFLTSVLSDQAFLSGGANSSYSSGPRAKATQASGMDCFSGNVHIWGKTSLTPGNTFAYTTSLYVEGATGRVGVNTTSPGAYALDINGEAHASAFPTSSDARLKEHVETISGALGKVRRIRGVTFDWVPWYQAAGRGSNRRQMGVLADEVEVVAPEIVTRWACDVGKERTAARRRVHDDAHRARVRAQAEAAHAVWKDADTAARDAKAASMAAVSQAAAARERVAVLEIEHDAAKAAVAEKIDSGVDPLEVDRSEIENARGAMAQARSALRDRLTESIAARKIADDAAAVADARRAELSSFDPPPLADPPDEERVEDLRAVDYGRLTALLIEAVKELASEKDRDILELRASLATERAARAALESAFAGRLAALEQRHAK